MILLSSIARNNLLRKISSWTIPILVITLYDRLINFFEAHPNSELCAAVESTGGYENNWHNTLRKFQSSLNIKTARLNPAGVSKNSKASMKRVITDKMSAQGVAEYLITHPEKVMYQQQDYWASLRKQWSFVKMLTKQSSQLLNQLEPLLYSANPEILKYCQDGVPAWVLKLLKQYPTAAKLARATSVASEYRMCPCRTCHGELIATAQKKCCIGN